jgi:surface antigen
MKFRFVAPLLGMVFLTACGGGSGSGHGSAPAIPSVAATKSLDDVDQAFMAEHFNKAMESTLTGQSSSWTNPSSGYQVQVAPTRTFQQADSTYCREFTQSITSGNQPATTRGTACRQSDGSWQIVG